MFLEFHLIEVFWSFAYVRTFVKVLQSSVCGKRCGS